MLISYWQNSRNFSNFTNLAFEIAYINGYGFECIIMHRYNFTHSKPFSSFYSMFNTHPVGKYKLAVCGNLPCEMNGGDRLADYLKEKLGIGFGETTPDGLFTLVESECMGACGDGPVILVNNHVMHMHMSKEKVDRLLEELRA